MLGECTWHVLFFVVSPPRGVCSFFGGLSSDLLDAPAQALNARGTHAPRCRRQGDLDDSKVSLLEEEQDEMDECDS